MKTTAFLLAVLTVLGVGMIVSSGDALAGTISTSTTSLGSTTFGFDPSAANIKVFTRQTAAGDTYCQTAVGGVFPSCTVFTAQPVTGSGLFCSGTTSLNCSANDPSTPLVDESNYVPLANSLPGALTSRPDKVISTWTDFGCGDNTPTGGSCVEGAPETGINTMSRVLQGHNTAGPDQNSCLGVVGGPGCAPDGVLTGALHSLVALENLGDPEMPSGSIEFDWTPGISGGGGLADPNNGSATFTQTINHDVIGLYTFSEVDTTNSPILTYASRQLSDPNDPDFPAEGVPHNRAGADTAPPLTLGEKFPTMLLVDISTTLDVAQTTMGGLGTNTENIGYTVDWAGATFGHPGGGAYFTPGLNVRDWNGNAPPAPTPNPPGDGVGFAN